MSMTHFMELLVANQPWNLIFFLAIPFILTVIVAFTELYVLYRKETHGKFKTVNVFAGWLVALYFSGVVWYFLTELWLPLTLGQKGGWRGPIDFVAVTSYVGCYFPLLGMAISDLPWVKIRKRPERRLLIHAGFVGLFLIFAHLALLTGLLDPTSFGFWKSR